MKSKAPRWLKSVLLFLALGAPLYGSASQFPITANQSAKLTFGAVFDGTNYLVPIQGDGFFTRANTTRQIAAQLISKTGTPVGSLIDLGKNATSSTQNTPIPYAAFDGTNYLLVWTDSANSPNEDIYGQFISPAGALVGAAFPITVAPAAQFVHGIVFDGANYLVVWEDFRRGGSDVYGQRVSRTGALLGGEIRISPADNTRFYGNNVIAQHENHQLVPGATNLFVVWTQGPPSGLNNTEVAGQFVSPSGALVGAPITIKPFDGVQISVPNLSGIGFDGTNYLVAWHQDVSATEHDLLGQRVSRSGGLLGGVVPISAAPAKAAIPFFVFDGANYLAIWTDSFGATNQSCKARFIDPLGNPVSSEFAPFLAQGTNAPAFAAPLFDGKNFFVVGLIGSLNAGDIYGTFISPLPRGAFPIGITSSNEFGLSAAFDGVNYLMGIQGGPQDHDEVTAQLFSQTGALIGSRISANRFGGHPIVAFDGANYLMVWEDVANNARQIYGQFVSPAGALVRSPFAISASIGITFLDSINPLVFDGTNYFVVWRDERNGHLQCDVYGQLIAPSGALVGAEIPVATEAEMQLEPSVGFDGANFFVAYQNRRATTAELYDTYGKFVSRSGTPGASMLISQAPSPRFNPISVAFDGTNYLVVWNRDIGPGFPSPTDWDIYGRLVSRSGSFAGNEFPITTASGSQIFFGSAVFDGTSYLASWIDSPSGSLKNRFFNRAGAPVTTEFSLFGSQGAKSPVGGFIFGGSRLIAIATFVESNFSNGDLYGLIPPQPRLDFAGPVANGSIPLRFTGMPGVTYDIQSTPDLSSAPIWSSQIATNSPTGTFITTDTNTTTFPRRFYRAVQQ